MTVNVLVKSWNKSAIVLEDDRNTLSSLHDIVKYIFVLALEGAII